MREKQPPPSVNAVVYARYSSHSQNDASIEQQLAECDEYAKSHNYNIIATYADRAISGRSDRRPEFQKMLRAAEKREFQVVLAYKSNRISRNMLHALSYENKLAQFGVNVIYCKEEFGNNAAGRFALRTMMNVNQFYSENMAEDIMRGMMDNAHQCKVNGSLPFGYKRGEDGKYQIDEQTAPIVQEIFKRIADGESKACILDDLNRRCLRTKSGGAWNKNSFNVLLKNERYTGVYIYKDVRIPDGIPAIITQELFAKALDAQTRSANIVKGRRRRKDMDYILTGKLFCGLCGEAMVGTSGTSQSGRMYYYYKCRSENCNKKLIRNVAVAALPRPAAATSSRSNPKDCRDAARTRATAHRFECKDNIESLVTDALRDCITDPKNIDSMVDLVMKYKDKLLKESNLSYLEEKLKENKTITKNVMKAIEMGIVTETTKARLQELEAEQKDILSQILAEKRSIPDITRDHVRFFFESFRNGDVNSSKYKKMLAQQFLRAVYLYEDHLKITFDFDDSDTGTDLPLESASDENVRISELWYTQISSVRTAQLRMIGRIFVLTIQLKKRKS